MSSICQLSEVLSASSCKVVSAYAQHSMIYIVITFGTLVDFIKSVISVKFIISNNVILLFSIMMSKLRIDVTFTTHH